MITEITVFVEVVLCTYLIVLPTITETMLNMKAGVDGKDKERHGNKKVKGDRWLDFTFTKKQSLPSGHHVSKGENR